VLLLVAAVVAGLTPLGDALWWQESRATPMLGDALRGLKPVLPEEFARHLPV
jgi:membrane protein required for colicin V production